MGLSSYVCACAGGNHTELLARVALPALVQGAIAGAAGRGQPCWDMLAALAVCSPALRAPVMTELSCHCLMARGHADKDHAVRLAALTALADTILPACSQMRAPDGNTASVEAAASEVAMQLLQSAKQVSSSCRHLHASSGRLVASCAPATAS